MRVQNTLATMSATIFCLRGDLQIISIQRIMYHYKITRKPNFSTLKEEPSKEIVIQI